MKVHAHHMRLSRPWTFGWDYFLQHNIIILPNVLPEPLLPKVCVDQSSSTKVLLLREIHSLQIVAELHARVCIIAYSAEKPSIPIRFNIAATTKLTLQTNNKLLLKQLLGYIKPYI